ncbi:MAG: purine-nucleoside phosphorylase [Anaerolineae bacterium]|nr:purine-nucleoside phosphorylase [Anaerolineae bacterium]MDW8100057.1 purine-nucleoside phosphorylase [Anaerolineae bacterium]
MFTPDEFQAAAEAIRSRTRHRPTIGLVLGSGLSSLADYVQNADVIPYAEVPHFPVSTVEGHAGCLIVGQMAGPTVMVMQGRVHYYEGYSLQEVTFPIRVMRLLGIDLLVLTNAAGGVNPSFRAGDLMLITDHINLIGMAGLNPLRGPNNPAWGPRFLDMSNAYDRHLRLLTLEVARELDIPLHQGIYAGLSGPTFETPAEVRFLRLIGADAVGMSTVAETIVARHCGMRVLGISVISNAALAEPDIPGATSHEEVLEAGKAVAPRLARLILGVLPRLIGSPIS